MSPERAGPAEFLAFLVDSSLLSPEGSGRVAHALASTSHPFDTVVTELGLLREDELATHLADFLRAPRATARDEPDPGLIDRAGLSFLDDHALLPLSLDDDALCVAACDPFSRAPIDALAFHFDRSPALRMQTRSAILAQLRSLREPAADAFTNETDEGLEASVDDVDRLRDIAREAPVVRFVSKIIGEAVERGATDIHVEPLEEVVRIRFRLDGMLHPADTAPRGLHAGLVSRIKILANLNIAERRIPQDGRMRVAVRGQNVDMRVSVVPSAHGEAIVLRILDSSRVQLDLGALGFDAAARARLHAFSNAANGIVLVTGPTGSGKTTTLYSLLKARNSADTKIFTVEDPIEVRLPGVTQLQVDPAIDLDFAAALRSVLRQDPDVILVGEIRDRETAEIAIRAALTGHLVFSTLHTNSAAGAFTRLRDIGIDPYLLGATIRGVVGQRLLRRACEACAEGGREAATPCSHCRGSGYAGRTVTYELLPVSDAIAQLVAAGAREDDIQAIARQEGMTTLAEHADALAQAGVTRRAEVRRVIHLGEA